MTIEMTRPTAAQRFHDSAAVEEAVAAIMRRLREAQTEITAVRPPSTGDAETYQSWLDRLARARGRPPFYPYLGSGLGHGALVELADGSVKWDMITGIGAHPFGHSEPDLVETAVRAALSDTVMQGNLQCNEELIRFSELLIEDAARTSGIRHCFLTNSGAMANESALKVCFQKHAPASRILAFAHSFAGRSTTMAQITDNPSGRQDIPLSTLVDYVPFYDPALGEESVTLSKHRLQEYIERYPGQHACFCMELVQGEGGLNVAPREFLEPLMQLCRKHDIGVWADEVQSFGRTNTMFHFEQLGLGEYVDVASIGKLSQVCACLYTDKYNPRPGLLSGTFAGSTAGLRVGYRILQRLRDGGYYGDDGKIARLFRTFCDHVKALVDKHPDWFPRIPHPLRSLQLAEGFYGGVGGMMRFTPFGGEKAAVMNLLHRMFDLGVIAFYCGHGPFHVRMLPPVGVMEPGRFADVFEIVETAMAETASELGR